MTLSQGDLMIGWSARGAARHGALGHEMAEWSKAASVSRSAQ